MSGLSYLGDPGGWLLPPVKMQAMVEGQRSEKYVLRPWSLMQPMAMV